MRRSGKAVRLTVALFFVLTPLVGLAGCGTSSGSPGRASTPATLTTAASHPGTSATSTPDMTPTGGEESTSGGFPSDATSGGFPTDATSEEPSTEITSSSDPWASGEAAEAALRAGRIEWKAPTDGTVGTTVLVDAMVTVNSAAPMESSGPGETVGGATVMVGPQMRAQLTGNDFTISAASPSATQQLTADNVAEWSWQVTPRQAGDLLLTLTVVPTVNGVDFPGRSSSYRLAVRVAGGRSWPAAVAGWLGNNVVNVVATLVGIAGVVISYLAYQHNRHEKELARAAPQPPSTNPAGMHPPVPETDPGTKGVAASQVRAGRKAGRPKRSPPSR